MANEVTIDQVLVLINTLYNCHTQDDSNREKIHQANAWLGQLQKSVSFLLISTMMRNNYSFLLFIGPWLESC